MHEVKSQGKKILHKMLSTAQRWFSKLVDETDFYLSKALRLLQETKAEFELYVQDRHELTMFIELKQHEILELHEKLSQLTAESSSKQYAAISDELSHKVNELHQAELDLEQLEAKLNLFEIKMEQVQAEQLTTAKERDTYREQYQELDARTTQLIEEKNSLLIEVEALKQEPSSELLIEKQIRVSELEREVSLNQQELDHLKKEFQRKLQALGKLNSQFHEYKQKYCEEKHQLANTKEAYEQAKLEVTTLQNDREKLYQLTLEKEAEMLRYLKEMEQIVVDKQEAEARLKQIEVTFAQKLVVADMELQNAKAELEQAQETIAVKEAEKTEVSPEDKEKLIILRNEYEIRFRELYKRAVFREEFFQDFYALTASDRLKAEGVIAGLVHENKLTVSSIRKNPVQVSGGTIPEYRFGDTGRIYCRKEQGSYHFIRLSRTKNGKGRLDQAKVIKWMQKNVQ
ncbi:hypothetical protein [Alkalicoccus luteus]|uniref:Uncharacterized protein n=1 Tax=Alkalicoccus luteus TaxID=1237094 RepID=A0A969TU79_9BACI|nr:hypothetical protein [Alkalicoccus luteus]NJP37060.1 hypothetical protein [Alkalicoccus luteus]